MKNLSDEQIRKIREIYDDFIIGNQGRKRQIQKIKKKIRSN